jgi:D-serine deaminase-like pyridoxal phosphate-dependent protein
VADHPEAEVTLSAEEHTGIENVEAHVGGRLRLIPSHCCTTSNLYRRMWLTRDDTILEVWPIEASGCLE